MKFYIKLFSLIFAAVISAEAHTASKTIQTLGLVNLPKSDDLAAKVINEIIQTKIKPISQQESIITAIKQQNIEFTDIHEIKIIAMDKKWRLETEKLGSSPINHPLIKKLLDRTASKKLRSIKEKQRGLFTEIIVTDNKGLNVAISDITSDYWQGDEDKWQKTFKVGPEAIFIDEPDLDESTQAFQLQVSITINDPHNNQSIGSLTVGLDLDLLELLLEDEVEVSSFNNRNLLNE
ncbi:hypothetical protein [Kiloniella litopenaei]|uniref:hypothetical protein n=1 Tax=Kiloniella litopenaei TaxID=1549748 RepID=UPI000698C0FC|nr:hypothetical protein [Kiloniella litopenaei]